VTMATRTNTAIAIVVVLCGRCHAALAAVVSMSLNAMASTKDASRIYAYPFQCVLVVLAGVGGLD
jgi:hypothetical protein